MPSHINCDNCQTLLEEIRILKLQLATATTDKHKDVKRKRSTRRKKVKVDYYKDLYTSILSGKLDCEVIKSYLLHYAKKPANLANIKNHAEAIIFIAENSPIYSNLNERLIYIASAARDKKVKPNFRRKSINEECEALLLKLFPDHVFTTNYSENWLVNPVNGYCFMLDFYSRDLKLAIEIEGIHHYQYTPGIHKTETDFEYQMFKDLVKRRACSANGVDLITVQYDEDITEKITSELKYIRPNMA
jgi:hypothetical protein